MAKTSTSKTSEKKSSANEKNLKTDSVNKNIASNKKKIEDVIITSIVSEQVDAEETFDRVVRDKLLNLFTLQTIDSRIDRIRIIRGELPLEVQDLEDDVAGLQTRLNNIENEITDYKLQSNNQKLFIKDCIALIKKYEEQQNNVRNNREFDSLNKEIQYQKLEIEHSEKIINDIAKKMDVKTEYMKSSRIALEERKIDLAEKKRELNEIIEETETDEKNLLIKLESVKKKIDERLMHSYLRLRSNAKNGLAVVSIERDACGGCFNKIPPQRQMEIKQHKKIIVCEYCGRILVDDSIANAAGIILA